MRAPCHGFVTPHRDKPSQIDAFFAPAPLKAAPRAVFAPPLARRLSGRGSRFAGPRGRSVDAAHARSPPMPRALHTCMLCEAVCGLAVEVEEGSIRGVRGDADDPFSKGHICPKAAAIADVQDDPDRIREPQRREGDRWRAVSWEAALDEAGARIAEVQRRHGRSAVAL